MAATVDDAHAIAAAAAGGRSCAATLERYATRLARALASVINILDPDVIVLGGGLSNIDAVHPRAALWGEWVFSDRVDTRLVSAPWRFERRARRGVAVGEVDGPVSWRRVVVV